MENDMPRQTFLNLTEAKRAPILTAALAEFSSHSYEAASINVICRESGIPKGSFYQYFENKYDLYRHLLQLAVQEKTNSLQDSLAMTSGKPMRERLKALYLSGFAFAALHPALAELGNRFAAETSRVVTEPVLKDANEPSSNLFLSLILEAQAVGEIRKEFSVNAILMLLFSVNAQIAEAVKGERGADAATDTISRATTLLDELMIMVFEGIGV